MKKVIFIIFIIFIGTSIFSQENLNDWDLYTQALEAMVDNNDQMAINRFEKLIDDYPDSILIAKAKLYLNQLKTKIDHSGIVTFYGSQLINSVYVLMNLPGLFDLPSDPAIAGITGLAGIGLGIWSAWYTSDKTQLSFAHELWIEGSLALMLTNHMLISNIIHTSYDNSFFGSKVFLATQIGLISAQRILSHFWIKETPKPSYGKPALALWAYAWGQFYSWAGSALIAGMPNSTTDTNIRTGISLGVSNAAMCAALLLWDHYPMSLERSGIISLGGIGGAGIGAFSLLITSSFTSIYSTEVTSLVLMLSALGGKILTFYLTKNMSNEKINKPKPKQDMDLAFFPSFREGLFGLECKLVY